MNKILDFTPLSSPLQKPANHSVCAFKTSYQFYQIHRNTADVPQVNQSMHLYKPHKNKNWIVSEVDLFSNYFVSLKSKERLYSVKRDNQCISRYLPVSATGTKYFAELSQPEITPRHAQLKHGNCKFASIKLEAVNRDWSSLLCFFLPFLSA